MTDSKTANMAGYWHGALISSSRQGIDGFIEFCGQDPVCLAKLRMLWIMHSGRYLDIYMHKGEVYEEWDKCTELSRRILDKAIQDILSEDFSPEDEAEIRKFHAEYAGRDYKIPDIKEELHRLFCDADEETLEKIDEEVLRRVAYDRWTLYDYQFARKKEVMKKYQKDSDEPPPGMDEFEYIDWVISHS